MSAGRKRVAILISGRGSNMEALIEACRTPDAPAEIVLVSGDRPQAPGLETARAAGLATAPVAAADMGRSAFETALGEELNRVHPDIVCLAGFMRILSADFLARREEIFLNIHPSLLPAFKGLHPQRQALKTGVKVSGCTVHEVTPDVDAGPILAQRVVPVFRQDTEDSLSARILTEEHICYPQALFALCRGKHVPPPVEERKS